MGYTDAVKKLTVQESAVMISKSWDKFFVGGQVSTISGINKYDQGIGGSRQLMTIGYDGKYASPFIQYQQLNH